MSSSLYDFVLAHRMKFGFAIVLGLAVVFAGIIAGYLSGVLSYVEVGVILSGVGALGTLTLATITVVSVLETRVQIRQQEKEQDKFVEEQILVEIKNLLEIIEENDEYLSDPEGYWTAIEGANGEHGFDYIDVEDLTIDHPIVSAHFGENYSDAKEQMEKYNECVVDIHKGSWEILTLGRDSIEMYIVSKHIIDSSGELVDPEEAISLVLSEHQGRSKSFGMEYPEWWDKENKIRRKLERAVEEHRLEEFFESKEELRITATNLEEELNEVRSEILEEYPVQPQS